MVGRMPKRSVQTDEIATRFSADEPGPETPAQKQQRIAQAIQDTQSLVGDINSGSRITRQIAKDDMVMRKAYRRAVQESMSLNDLAVGLGGLPGLSVSDVMLPDFELPGPGQQFLTEEFPTNHDDMIMEDLYQPKRPVRQVQQQPIRGPQRQPLTERSVQPRPAVRNALDLEARELWKVKRYLGETRSGNEVHVWRVENTKTGSKLQNLFRLEGVASRIALMLNESGDLNDPRVVSLANSYEKRDKLLKEARLLERSADGKVMKSERLRQIRAEINQLDYKLGV
jgi:hypothetical protein